MEIIIRIGNNHLKINLYTWLIFRCSLRHVKSGIQVRSLEVKQSTIGPNRHKLVEKILNFTQIINAIRKASKSSLKVVESTFIYDF